MGLFFVCLLLLTAIEGWYDFAPLPAHDWIADNLQKIRVNKPNELCFAVFGDNKNSQATFKVLLKQVDRDPDIVFALDLGDLVFDGEKEKYRYFFNQIRDNFQLPFLTAIGNHELRENGRGMYYDIFGRFYYSFRIGRNYFIVLDDANEVGLDQWQRVWLEKELKEAQSYNTRFVFMHVPLFDPRGNGYHHCLPKDTAISVIALFKKYHVTHIFASHIHGYFTGKWQGIPLTITGGAGGELYGRDPKHYFYHYLRVRVKDDRVSIDVHRIPSPDNEWLDRLGSVMWIYLYAFIRFHGIELALFLLMGRLLILAFARKPTE